jgi:hypothetical protein
MKKLWVGLIVLGLFCSLGTAHAASGGTNRPWHMQASATVTVVPPQFAGSFHGTHTGVGSVDGTFVVAGFPPPCGVGSVPITDSVTLTAANGDTIDQAWSGTVCQSGPNPTFHQVATYTITGGTGRFSSATGSGAVIADADFPNGLTNPGTITFTENGTISY